MKNRLALLIAGFMIIAGSSAFADNEWGVMATYWSPSDGTDSFGGGAKIGIEMVENVQLDLRWSYFNDVLDSPPGGPELQVQPLEFGLSFSSPLSEDTEASFGAGLGYYLMDGDVASGAGSGADDELGFYLSAGIEWVLSRSNAEPGYGQTQVKLFIDGIYRFVEADDVVPTGTPGVFADADLNGPGIMAGMLIAW